LAAGARSYMKLGLKGRFCYWKYLEPPNIAQYRNRGVHPDKLTCIKAVAIITPDPKYFVIKKANGGTVMRFVRAAAMGSKAPMGTNQLT
jgi:hypothetical protein